MPRRTNRMKRSIKSIREYECVCAARPCAMTHFLFTDDGWYFLVSFSIFVFHAVLLPVSLRYRREEKTKCNATHGKNMWFHFPWCIVNILQMKRYGLAHTWYKRWHTQLKRGKERNVVHLCSCSYQLRWKFIVICDPRGRLLYMCIDWSERTHRIKFVITNFGNDDMLLLLFHSFCVFFWM